MKSIVTMIFGIFVVFCAFAQEEEITDGPYITFEEAAFDFGDIHQGDKVERVGIKATANTVVTGVEMFRKLLDEGLAGDNIGVLLRGLDRTDIERGQVLAKPKSITPHTTFDAQVYVLKKEEGEES